MSARRLEPSLTLLPGTKNIKFVENQSGTDIWTVSPAKLKQELHNHMFVDIPPLDEWKISYLSSLLRQREEAKHLVLVNKLTKLQDLIDSLVK